MRDSGHLIFSNFSLEGYFEGACVFFNCCAREVSNPKSPKYGHYLSIDDLTALISPPQESIDATLAYLRSNGVTEYTLSANRDYLHFFSTLENAQDMFDVTFADYTHEDSGKVYTSSLGPYTMPTNVASYVDFVGGITGYTSQFCWQKWQKIASRCLKKRSLKNENLGAFQLGPKDLRQRYNVSMVGGHPNNSQSVAEFQVRRNSSVGAN